MSSLTFDSYYKSRRLYWSVPGLSNAADGNIYYLIVDRDSTVYSLLSIVGQSNLVNPSGMAIHYIQREYMLVVFRVYMFIISRCHPREVILGGSELS